jgi:UDP-N-acetylmuramoyl-tripeptide--D-alanyl-D-alanine ligase
MIVKRHGARSRSAARPGRGASVATAIPPNHAAFDARAAAAATGGTVVFPQEPARVARGFTTDSRAVRPGGGFVALRGERHDAHSYLEGAIAAGASLVVAERGRGPRDRRADVVEVDDTLAAWGDLARAHLRAWRAARTDARVVAITGSAGKTTTKELCAALLRSAAEVHATAGNLNNRVGLPAVALGLEAHHRFAVLEMGMSVRGEIAALAAIAAPDVAVVTNAGLAHAEGVGGTVEAVAREKGALFAALGPEGVAVANADDASVMRQTSGLAAGRVVTFGRSERADVRLVRRAALGAEGSRVHVRRGDQESAFVLPLVGEAAALDFVAALAAADAASGEPLGDRPVSAALRALAPIVGRMRPRRLKSGVLVLDDAYNANPASMRAALGALGEFPAARRVAVLGEMKELGAEAGAEHDKLGEAVARAGVDLLVSCGGLADATARSAARLGVEVVFAPTAAEAAGVIAERARPGDVVLVKASRSVGAERVVEALVEARGLVEPA